MTAKFPPLCVAAVAIGIVWMASPAVRADSTYDWLAGTHWYVPAANVLAYAALGGDLSNPLPVGDQTLWDITSSTNGVFSGTTTATLKILGVEIDSSFTMSGIATPEGQIRMIFTDTTSGAQTVGIGQFRNIGDEDFMEMQMMTGEGDFLVTHWAYMALVPDGSFVPPAPNPEINLLSTEWAWMDGTAWSLAAPGVFGTTDAAQFSVTGYRNGYFWGTGVAPDGEGFTHIGSVTPEGNVLFNVLVDGTLTNLTGQIAGDAATGTMALRGYVGTEDFGDAATASVVPEPGTVALLAVAVVILGIGTRGRRRGICAGLGKFSRLP